MVGWVGESKEGGGRGKGEGDSFASSFWVFLFFFEGWEGEEYHVLYM